MKAYSCLLLALLCLCCTLSRAQNKTITGTVFNDKGQPLSGATILVKGTNRRILTTTEGQFSITTPPKSTLLVSYVGYLTREVAVSGTVLRIILGPSAAGLDEVVVQAYGTTTRRYNTGSIGKVTATEIEQQPVSNPLSALQGRVPGVLITQSTGTPGAEVRIEIRGRSSLDLSLSRNDPLFVIDGVPFEPGNTGSNQLRSAVLNPVGNTEGGLSPLNTLNPADIESIEVLKDADATAIYGSRGANGVVLITTKKGRPGKTRLNVNSSIGISRVARMPQMMHTAQYVAMRREAFRNDGSSPTSFNAPDLLLWDTTRYTDLPKLLIGRSAMASFTQVALSGGSANTQFSLAGGYNRQTNVFSSTLSDQVRTARFSLTHQSADKKLNLQFSGIYASDRNRLVSTDLTRYINLPPHIRLYDAQGNLAWSENGVDFSSQNMINPLSILEQRYTAVTDNLSANLNLSYRVARDLSLRISAGYNSFITNETSIRPKASIAPTQSTLASSAFAGSSSNSYIVEPQAEYRRTIGSGVLSALAGTSFQDRQFSSYSLSGNNYTNDLLLGAIGAAGNITATNNAFRYRYAALFGRINFALDNHTYLLNLTGRKDASSRFGRDKQTAVFGAAGGAWVFSNHTLVKNLLPFLHFGKIRGSYGITGNDQIGNYRYLDLWNPAAVTYTGTPGFVPGTLYNADYSWEINRKLEGAVELGFLREKIFFSAAFYRNRCSNQITSYLLPVQTGFETIGRNLPALVQNHGWEFLLSAKPITGKAFQWSTSLNLTLPRNKLIRFPGLATSAYATLYQEGASLSLIRAYEYEGVDPQTGIYRFTDINKDGVLNRQDFVLYGNLDPRLYGGLQNTFSYKGLQLGIFFEFRQRTGRSYLSQLAGTPPGTIVTNQPLLVLRRWQQPGDEAPVQRYSANPGSAAGIAARTQFNNSTGIYQDASYIRCKNVSLAYNMPPGWMKKARMESCQLFVHAQNLFVLTPYEGTDPETQNFYVLPPLRTITAGLNITF